MTPRRLGLLAALILCTRCDQGDALFCGAGGCDFSPLEWSRVVSLSGFTGPQPDKSNAYVTDEAAIALGQRLYFDARLSGKATLVDMLGRSTQYARAPLGQPTKLSCATCHVPARAGGDFSSVPGNVSIGAGSYDVNGQQTVNSAAYNLIYWNGRVDSLWAQIVAVLESSVSMGGNRLAIAWRIEHSYHQAYASIFTKYPLPFTAADLAVNAKGINADGTCPLDPGAKCPEGCRTVTPKDASPVCLPRFPPEGRKGATAGCQWGSTTEPMGDAFDCMAVEDQDIITRLLVNVAKAIAAYEYQLISSDSAFDQFAAEGPSSTKLSAAARRGAKLFVGRAACIECHSSPLLSDNGFHNIGVPQAGPFVPTEADCPAGGSCDCVNGKNCLPWGAYDGLSKLKNNAYRRDLKFSDDTTDTSRADWVNLELPQSLKGAWRTPSLRDVALTAPYMHNGLYQTLGDVVHHYNVGGAEGGFSGSKAAQMRPLHLSEGDEADLVAFLESLTGAPLPSALVTAPTLP